MAQAAVNGSVCMPGKAVENAAIDRSQLARMTFGDHSLEREVLQLFDRQAELLIARMRASAPSAVATLAHTLKGSAVGIGAGRVARAAGAAEMAATCTPGECSRAVDELAQTVEEARTQIAGLLRAH
jgi:HPt (histidine-containing phosphotransfer) domain-containing protein